MHDIVCTYTSAAEFAFTLAEAALLQGLRHCYAHAV